MPMSLSEQFWRTLEDKQEALGPAPEGLDVVWHVLKPAAGDKSLPARELARLARISHRHHPPALLAQPSADIRPFVLVVSAPDKALPTFEELYQSYLDKNGFLAESLLLLRPHCEVPYALFVGGRNYFLYDLATEDILRWSSTFEDLCDLLLAPIERRENVRAKWDALARRTRSQRAEEFSHWMDLWRVAIGAHYADVNSPLLVQGLLQKSILLFLYDLLFGFSDEDLRLRKNFLAVRQHHRSASVSDPEADLTFDAVAWLHQASEELYARYQIEFLRWTEEESAFFSLMNNEARLNLRQFILELFLQSLSKFDVEVQAEAFSDPDARLKMWKFSVTETLNVRKRLHADEINVYAPLEVDLDESGVAWTLHVVGEILEYWREKCEQLEQDMAQRKRIEVQLDMFQHPDLEKASVPTRENLYCSTLPQSLRIFYRDPAERQTLEYLVNLKILDYCAKHAIPLHPLKDLERIFVMKSA
ncbi:MAG: hypothetical protein ACP5QZ_04515 [Candidatus Sumerlaeaceae bacterium]